MTGKSPRAASLGGKRAFVTGAARGIGARTAEALVREGAIVALHARKREQLEAVSECIRALGGEAVCVAGDLTDAGAIERLNLIEITDPLGAGPGPLFMSQKPDCDDIEDVGGGFGFPFFFLRDDETAPKSP